MPNLLVTKAKIKWLRTILGPYFGVVKRSRVPDDLIHQLRKFDRMGVRTRPVGLKGPFSRVGDMGCVIRAVEILPIPAARDTPVRSKPNVGYRQLTLGIEQSCGFHPGRPC